MKKKIIILALAALLVGLIIGAGALYRSLAEEYQPDQLATRPAVPEETLPEETVPEETIPEETQPEPEPVLAPDFTVYDADGQEVHLSDFVGKPVVLNFWASWCGGCQMEMPHFQQMYDQLGEEIHFVMVNMTGGRESRQSADAYLQETGYTFPVFYDTQADAAMVYSAYTLPMTVLIDAQGYVVAHTIGAINLETLQIGIDMIR